MQCPDQNPNGLRQAGLLAFRPEGDAIWGISVVECPCDKDSQNKISHSKIGRRFVAAHSGIGKE
jgi:hypothetical protein